MRLLICLLVLFLLPLSPANAAGDEARYELSVSGSIDIGPDGSVIAHSIDKGLTPAVRSLIDRNIETWRFEPILQDGRPVIASTRVQMALSAVPDGKDTLQLRVDKVWFGAPKTVDNAQAPKYPPQALRDRFGARVVLALELDENGKVIAAHPYQTSLSRSTSEGRAAKFRKQFEKASIAAAMEWTFTPGESIDGQKLGSRAMVPISFVIGSRMQGMIPVWRSFVPGPITPAPWADEAVLASVDTGNLADGEAAAIGSRFQLKTRVAGTVL